jgi:hypothetical protein
MQVCKYNSEIGIHCNDKTDDFGVILFIMLITFQSLCTITWKRSHGKLTLCEGAGLETLASNVEGLVEIEASIPGVTKLPLARERTWSFWERERWGHIVQPFHFVADQL